MCVSGDSRHFLSGPPPTAEVVQWTQHMVRVVHSQPNARRISADDFIGENLNRLGLITIRKLYHALMEHPHA